MTNRIHSGLTGTTSNEFYLGDGVDGYKTFYANTSSPNKPGIRLNNVDGWWEYSDDGIIWNRFSSTTNVETIVFSSPTNNSISVESSTTDGYSLTISAGTGDTSGGTLTLAAGDNTTDGYAGSVIIQTGVDSNGTAGTVVVGNDAATESTIEFLSVNSTETGAAAIKVSVDGNLQTSNNDGIFEDVVTATGWVPISQFSDTASSPSQISLTSDLRIKLLPGIPVRILDACPYSDGYTVFNGTTNNIKTVAANLGYLYYSVVKTIVGPPDTYTVYVKNGTNTSTIASGTFLSTDSFPTDVQLLDGYGDLFATRTINSAAEISPNLMHIYKYGIISSCTSNLLTIRGHELSTVAGDILKLWYGTAPMVVSMDLYIPGAYAEAASTTLLADNHQHVRWAMPPGRFVAANFYSDAVASTYPTINVKIDGTSALSAAITLNSTSWFKTTTYPLDNDKGLKDTDIEITQGATGSASNTDLNMTLIFVLE